MMRRIAIGAIATFSLASLGGAALADTPAQGQNTPATSSESTAQADTDEIQFEDQNGPDTESKDESEGESKAEADGPGGHEDPAGDVNHEFDGEE